MSVAIAYNDKLNTYIKGTYSYSPDTLYPEYTQLPYGEKQNVSPEKNEVYALVRECFRVSGYDVENYGKANWNPLGYWVKPGQTVLIKPNWVEHVNNNKKIRFPDSMHCLVTNPAVLRAIIDYTIIAFKGKNGRIIVADAPMQSCNLQTLFQVMDYNSLWNFYLYNSIEIVDLRKFSVSYVAKSVLSSKNMIENPVGTIRVDLGQRSAHSGKDDQHPHYKVSDYPEKETRKYHSNGHHIYELNKLVLDADVIINVPKPKTHRLAGMTAAIKNFVGITYDKTCLPHRIEDRPEKGGDSYQKKSIWKEIMHLFDEKMTKHSNEGKYITARVDDFLLKGCYCIGCLTTGDKYRIGSWYGNDTIWRTSLDLNNILLFADKQGKITNHIQRKILTIGDMIICGQNEGPIAPTPKPLGMIMLAESALEFDVVMCEIMGFDKNKLRLFNAKETYRVFSQYKGLCSLEEENIFFAQNNYLDRIIPMHKFRSRHEWNFNAHSCWKDHIEQ